MAWNRYSRGNNFSKFSGDALRKVQSHGQKDDEAVKVTERRSRDSKEINANDVPGMIGEESLPGLGGRLRRFDSVLSDSRFSHFEPE